MRIIFAGTPEVAVPSLQALVAAGHEVCGVITREDAPFGRKRVLTPSPIAAAAAELDLPVFKANRLDGEAVAWAESLQPELGVVVAFGGLLRENMLVAPRLGWVNLHFSSLPRWRGAAPVQRALMAGESRLGVSVFRLVHELDAGDIVVLQEYDFVQGTSAGQVLADLAEKGTEPVLQAVDILTENPDAGTPQTGETSYAHKLERADGRLDFSLPAEQVLAHWAGVTPEPGAFVMFDEQSLKIHDLQLPESSVNTPVLEAGQAVLQGGAAFVGTGSANLQLLTVQPAGKPRMAAADWLRGRGGEAVLA
ncbi:MAG: methionyl-tRNA formyltransferase [Microbacteriaceae bacterium]|nr:methionyl-tRNA formyltransferase [Microbacteriaceae bacterium]